MDVEASNELVFTLHQNRIGACVMGWSADKLEKRCFRGFGKSYVFVAYDPLYKVLYLGEPNSDGRIDRYAIDEHQRGVILHKTNRHHRALER